jgi:hypothetical protein
MADFDTAEDPAVFVDGAGRDFVLGELERFAESSKA